MISFGKNAREKARQLKQIEKSAKRLQAKKQKIDMEKIFNKEPRLQSQSRDLSLKGQFRKKELKQEHMPFQTAIFID